MKKDNSTHVPQRDKIKEKLLIRELQWTDKQKRFIELALRKETRIIFCSGPAGSGKSLLAVYCGLRHISEKRVSEIFYVRSAVESSDARIGFLPGTVEEKMRYYNLPFYDKLDELLPKTEVEQLRKEERTSAFAVNFARGASWNAKCVILDECLPGYTYIITRSGKKSLFAIERDFRLKGIAPEVLTFNEFFEFFEWKPIEKIWSNGKREIMEIRAGLRKIHCTPNHRILTVSGWKRADEIRRGDVLVSNGKALSWNSAILNDDQLQIFLGSYLGDGHVQPTGGLNKARLGVTHGAKQEKYCEWKAQMFGKTCKRVEKNGFAQNLAFKFCTQTFPLPGPLPCGKKLSCPTWIVEKLDARALAIWYMDDGHINEAGNRIVISTCSFDAKSNKNFVKKLQSFGVSCKVTKYFKKNRNRSYYSISINAEGTKKFLEIVSPYMHPNLAYKSYLSVGEYKWDNKFHRYNGYSCSEVRKLNKTQNVFDLHVKDNHNFLVTPFGKLSANSGIVVHNCQNSTSRDVITILTRLGKFSKCFVLADPMQTDLSNGRSGGFEKIAKLFDDQESRDNGIFNFNFDKSDIVRSDLVRFLVSKLETLNSVNHQ